MTESQPLKKSKKDVPGAGQKSPPSKQKEGRAPSRNVPQRDPPAPNDPVDESSWESFPASDPPAH